jgi:hypothetical protein
MNNREQTDRELEQFLLELNQKELTEGLVKEQITTSLKRLEELHYEIARIGLDLELQFMRMKAVYKNQNKK